MKGKREGGLDITVQTSAQPRWSGEPESLGRRIVGNSNGAELFSKDCDQPLL